MILKQENILYPIQSSFKILKYSVPFLDIPFHYHSEVELVYITKGTGIRYIGDSVKIFKNGDLVLIGPNLGHTWVSAKKYKENKSTLITEAIVLQFPKELFSSMSDTPEFAQICKLLIDAEYGLKITGDTNFKIAGLLEELLLSDGIDRILNLIKILSTLSKRKNLIPLNSTDYSPNSNIEDNRINAVHHLVISSYQKKIGIKEAAAVAHMEQSAFCRYFKKKTKKTFTQFLNETRVDRACKLILSQNFSMSQIAYDNGFNNMANFYRQFKKHTGKTPGEYQKE